MTQPTPVPDSYDFNEHYTPLYVMNQGGAPTCEHQVRAAMCSAFKRMYEDKEITYDPDTLQYEHLADGVTTVFHLPDGERTWQYGGLVNDHDGDGTMLPVDLDRLKEAVWRNGIVQCMTAESTSLGTAPWGAKTLPVIPWKGETPEPGMTWHDLFVVGFTINGEPIIQNSWSLSWGFNGRAALSVEYCQHIIPWFEIDGYNDHPIGGWVCPPPHNNPTPPPTPIPAPRGQEVLLIHKPGDRVVYAVTGGHLDRVPNPTETAAIAALTGQQPVEVPLSNPVWKLPLLTH